MHDGELNYPTSRWCWPATCVGKAMPLGERIRDFPGLQLRDSFVREYPHGDLAANVLGYIGAIQTSSGTPPTKRRGYQRNDRVGLAGVKQYEQYLRGINGGAGVEVDAFGNQVGREFGTKPPQQEGKNLQLTIDANVEREIAAGPAGRTRSAVRHGRGRRGDGSQKRGHPGLSSYPFPARRLRTRKSRAIKAYAKASGVTTPMLDRATQGRYPPASR
ncbi:MAG: hypothetical protein U0Y82_09095 [Thermoleophilia bacterium]